MAAFIIWLIMAFIFIAMGLYLCVAKKAKVAGFWANAKTFPVENVRAYNKAVGKLWCVYGVVLALLGIPLLGGQNSAGGILISVVGTMIVSIAAMIVYVVVIESKYRKK